MVGPEYPLPPHWPYKVWLGPAGAEVVIAEEELRLVVADDVDLGTVVVLLLVPPVLTLPGTVAMLVAVAVELLCVTLEGRPDTTVGPGIVYVSGLV